MLQSHLAVNVQLYSFPADGSADSMRNEIEQVNDF